MIIGPLTGNRGASRVTAVWIASGRFYVLSGELSQPIPVGVNLDSANALANSIE